MLKNIQGIYNLQLVATPKNVQTDRKKTQCRTTVATVVKIIQYIKLYGSRGLRDVVFPQVLEVLLGRFRDMVSTSGFKYQCLKYRNLDYETLIALGLDALTHQRRFELKRKRTKKTRAAALSVREKIQKAAQREQESLIEMKRNDCARKGLTEEIELTREVVEELGS